jgi:methyl-accepting chemotaxis protein
MNHDTLLLIFVGCTGLALLVQAIVVLFAFLFVRKTVQKLQEDVGDLRSKAAPFLTKSHEIMERVSPRIESISSDVADLTRRAREQGEDIHAAATEILGRVNRQTSRVDTMFTSLFDSIEHAGNVVADSMTKPARQVSGVIAAARAFLNVLAKGRGPEEARVTTDQDIFV